MSRRSLYNFLFFLIPIIYFLSLPIVLSDLAVWVSHGKYFLQTGNVLRHDIYSILPTSELIYPVGSSVLYAIIYNLGGIFGVSLFHKLVVLLLSYIWYKSSLQNIKFSWTNMEKFIIFLGWFGCSLFCVDRPALLATVPLVISFLILQKEEDLSWKDLFKLIIINIVWVNLHGSWILLFVMYCWREFARFITKQSGITFKNLFGIFALTLSSLLNPFTYKMFNYVIETALISKERKFNEWGATSLTGTYFSQALAYYLLLALFTIFVIYLIKTNRKRAQELFCSPFVVLLLLGLTNIRNTSLAFFVLIPFAAHFKLFERAPAEEKKTDSLTGAINFIIVSFAMLITVCFLPYVKPYMKNYLPKNKQNIFDEYSPFALVKYLNETQDSDPIFNEWEYGSFLILFQKHRIFADTRNIIFNSENVAEYFAVTSADNSWETILQKYKIKYILINVKLKALLVSKIINSKNWEMVKIENESILFKRKEPRI